MRPAYRILANGVDLADKLAGKVRLVKVTDAAGYDSDALELELADDDPTDPVQIPPTGAELDVWLGYKATGLQHVGLFVVDEAEPGGWPAYLTIRARATPYEGSKQGKTDLQTQKTRAWPKSTKLGDMVAKIAKEHGLQATVAPTLRAVALPQFDQTDESDISFLARVARKYDAVVKSAGGSLVVVKRGELKSASGADLPAVTVTPQQTERWSMTISVKDADGTVVAFYHDHGTAKRTPVQVGSGDPVRRLRHPYPDRDSALRAAQGEHDKRGRKRNKLSITMQGDPTLTAEGKLELSGFRAGVPTDWVVTQVVHQLVPDQGYTTEVDAELPKGDQSQAPAPAPAPSPPPPPRLFVPPPPPAPSAADELARADQLEQQGLATNQQAVNYMQQGDQARAAGNQSQATAYYLQAQQANNQAKDQIAAADRIRIQYGTPDQASKARAGLVTLGRA